MPPIARLLSTVSSVAVLGVLASCTGDESASRYARSTGLPPRVEENALASCVELALLHETMTDVDEARAAAREMCRCYLHEALERHPKEKLAAAEDPEHWYPLDEEAMAECLFGKAGKKLRRVLERQEKESEERREAVLQGTRVSNVTDEPLLSAGGHPIGMRLSFDVLFPESTVQIVWPSVSPGIERMRALWKEITSDEGFIEFGPISLEPTTRSIEPLPAHPTEGTLLESLDEETPLNLGFEGGVTYHFSFELLPGYLDRDGHGYCRIEPTEENWRQSEEVFEKLISADLEVQYEVRISGTLYGNWHGRSPEKFTEHRYSPRLFHEGMVEAGIGPCDPRRAHFR